MGCSSSKNRRMEYGQRYAVAEPLSKEEYRDQRRREKKKKKKKRDRDAMAVVTATTF